MQYFGNLRDTMAIHEYNFQLQSDPVLFSKSVRFALRFTDSQWLSMPRKLGIINVRETITGTTESRAEQ